MKVTTTKMAPAYMETNILRYAWQELRNAVRSLIMDYANAYSSHLKHVDFITHELNNYKIANKYSAADALSDAIWPHLKSHLESDGARDIPKLINFDLTLYIPELTGDKTKELELHINSNGNADHPFSDTLVGKIKFTMNPRSYWEYLVYPVGSDVPEPFDVPTSDSVEINGNIFKGSKEGKNIIIAFSRVEEQRISEVSIEFKSFSTEGFTNKATEETE